MRKIVAVGPLWRGSNAGGLFYALSRQQCFVDVIDEFYYISLRTSRKSTKIMERFLRPRQVDEFNMAIKKNIDVFKPDVLLVYKGAFVKPETLHFARQKGCKLVQFYPDVSMTAHGGNIPQCMPLYDLVFTTKTFGIRDLESHYGVKNAVFIPHGFDPAIHRKLDISADEYKLYGCDVSFIGTWSPKKEMLLLSLKEALPQIDLKIWGDQWFKASSPAIKSSIQGRSIMGDLYALAIQCSKVNLGILNEQVTGASSGDLITSRTFHIPGSSGFMLHERNEESVLYFKEDEEAGFFDGGEELVKKVSYYLGDDALREKVALAGYQRALADHSLDERAKVVIGSMRALAG